MMKLITLITGCLISRFELSCPLYLISTSLLELCSFFILYGLCHFDIDIVFNIHIIQAATFYIHCKLSFIPSCSTRDKHALIPAIPEQTEVFLDTIDIISKILNNIT